MKRIVSLLMIVAMLCSLMMVVNADSTGEITFTIASTATEVKASSQVVVTITAAENSGLLATGFYFYYDPNVFTTVKTSGLAKGNKIADGTLKFGYADTSALEEATEIAKITFKASATPELRLDKLFSMEMDTNSNHIYSPSCGWADEDDSTYTSIDKITIVDATNIKVPTAAKEFEVTAVENGNDVVVTVANKGDKAGFVYVANYVNGVLDNCEVKALADGELTFTGLAGDAKVFVWDANNAPLLDAAISL